MRKLLRILMVTMVLGTGLFANINTIEKDSIERNIRMQNIIISGGEKQVEKLEYAITKLEEYKAFAKEVRNFKQMRKFNRKISEEEKRITKVLKRIKEAKFKLIELQGEL